jgi:Tfp pilus assembly protein PilF/arylsulfatase A-like enzyme
VFLVVLAGVWLASGLRRLDDQVEFGVLDGLLVADRPIRVEGRWSIAPPLLLRLERYPRIGVELPLPGADALMLDAGDGRRFGFSGTVTVRARPDEWRRLHEAAAGLGIRGALAAAAARAGAAFAPEGGGPVTSPMIKDVEQALTEELGRVGLEVRQLHLEGLDYLTVEEGAVAPPSTARLLVVGLDGADWAILDPLLEQGRLPNLRRLIDQGVRAKLLTISPMLSPVIWTSIATGVEPSRHGVIDFLVEDDQDGEQQPVTSAQRRVPAVWEMLSRSGVDVGVTAWWATWPADPVRGYVVSDRIAYQLFGFRADPEESEGKTWPPDLYDDIRPWIVSPDEIGWDRVETFLDGPRRRREQFDGSSAERLDGLRTLLASGDTYLRIADELRTRFDPRFEVVYFEGTDTIGHLFMPFRPPLLPGIDPEDGATFGQVVDRYYETADRYLGKLLAGRGDDWTVMILSDHGFASDASRPRTTDSRIGHGPAADWHRRFGVLILSGARVRAGARLDEASVYDIAPTILALFGQPVPRSWPGRVLGTVLDPGFLERYPVRYRPDDPERDEPREVHDDPAAADLIEKLRSLGYVSSGTEGSESLTARNNAGVALLAEGRFAEAEEEFRAGLEAEPRAAMLRLNLGVALRFQGRGDEAVPYFVEAMQVPETLRVAGNQLAMIRFQEGRLTEAERTVRTVLASEPGASDSRNLLGRLLERQGDLEGAHDEYLRSAELDPDFAHPRNNLGNLAKLRGDLDAAETWYLRAIEADPYFMGSYNNLALVYQDRGQLDKALDLYRRALAKTPDNAELLNNVGSWYYATGEFDEAAALWKRATLADPEYPSPLNNLAGLAINDKRYAEAEQLLRRAIDLDPDYGDARINLALVEMARKRFDAAREQLRHAAQDPRAAPRAWLQLGFIELEQGYVDAAIAAFERTLSYDGTIVQALNGLGESYRLAGRTADAIATWRRSLELNPAQERLRTSLEQLERLE